MLQRFVRGSQATGGRAGPLWGAPPKSRHTRGAPKGRPAAAYGPEPPPKSRGNKPPWVRILEEDAGIDEDVASLLEGTDGDPDRIRAKMEARLSDRDIISPRSGSEVPPRILFREIDQFDLTVWLEMGAPLTATERDMLSSALKSWFIVGKLGGYNSQNMQVYNNSTGDLSYLDYDNAELRGEGAAGGGVSAFMHEMGEPEFNGALARFRCDLGTADELALDVLINVLAGFSRDIAAIQRITFGGIELHGWGMPEGRAKGAEPPKVGIDPMRLPEGIDDEMVLLDQLDEMQRDIKSSEKLAGARGPGGMAAAAAAAAAAGRPVGPIGSGQRHSGPGWSRGGSAAAAEEQAPPQQQQQQQQQPAASGRGRRRAAAAAGGTESGARAARTRGGVRTVSPPPDADQEGMSVMSEEEFRRTFPSRDGGGP